MKRLAAFTAVSLLVFVAIQPAAFGRGSSAIVGAEDWFAGVLPPPGWHYLNYVLYYTADEMTDSNGDEITQAPFTNFDAQIWAEVIRPLYVSRKTVLGGNYVWHAVIPVVSMDLKSDFFSDSASGIGDVYVSAGVLAWHRKDVHYAAGLDIITPTGGFDENDIANIGNNHWTFEPAFAVTKMYAGGWQGDAKLMFDFHTENTDTNYKTANQFHMDYNLGKALSERTRLGVCGYYLKSLEDDEVDGQSVENSEEQVLAVGPSFMYHLSKHTSLILKAQMETSAENRPKGTSYWFRVIHSF